MIDRIHSLPHQIVIDWHQSQKIAQLAQKLDRICLGQLPLPSLLKKTGMLATWFKLLSYCNDHAKNLLF
jgi:hypothetical protein